MTQRLEVVLFGEVTILKEDGSVTDRLAPKEVGLFIYLLCHNQPQPREHLAELFWPERPQKLSLSNLRTALTRLRRHLAPYLLVTRQTIAIHHELCRLDVAEFETGLAALNVSSQFEGDLSPATAARLTALLQLYTGDFLHNFSLPDSYDFEEWLLLRREQLRQQAIVGLHHLIPFHLHERRFTEAGEWANRLLALNPLDESGHRYLMQAMAGRGQRTAALEQYATCQRLLAETFGAEPAAETVRLYEQIQSGELSGDVENPAEGQGRGGAEEIALPPSPRPAAPPPTDWGDAPGGFGFYGRTEEQRTLRSWLGADRCRLIALLGIGGQGKTALAAQVVRTVEADFELVIWRSLLNAPPLDEILQTWLQALSEQIAPDASLDYRLNRLFERLRQWRCLLILDNAESLMQSGEHAGEFRAGYEAYGQLFRRFGESDHHSCLLLTSREKPKRFTRLERPGRPVRSLRLGGLDVETAQTILQMEGLVETVDQTAALVERYSGNPLALILVADTVREIFEGDLTTFLNEEAAIFEDVQDVLDQQFTRLPALEQTLMVWLAIEREATSIQTLSDNLVETYRQGELLAALRSLQRRSLIDKREAGFTLQNVVTEYLTDRLLRHLWQEIIDGPLDGFNRYALIKANAKAYVRHSQARLILAPLADWLAAHYGPTVADQARHLLTRVRLETPAQGYAGGNLLNLMLHLGLDCRGMDFSGLSVWQAYLRGKQLPAVNFADADLRGSVLTDTFSSIYSVAFSPDGQWLAAGTGTGDIRLWQVATGQPVAVFEGHQELVWTVAFSPDGRWLAGGSEDQTVSVWDTRTRQRLNIFREHSDTVTEVVFSPDSRYLASGSGDGTVLIWAVGDDREPLARLVCEDEIKSVAFSPDGQMVAAAGHDQKIRLWETNAVLNGAGRQNVRIFEGHSRMVRSLAFSPDGHWLASGSDDQTVRVWAVESGYCQHILQGHQDEVHNVTFSPDGQILAGVGFDQAVRLWRMPSGEATHTLYGHTQPVTALAFSPDGHIIASGSDDQTVRLWDADSGRLMMTLQGYSNATQRVAFSPDGQTIASSGEDELIYLWQIGTDHPLKSLAGHVGHSWGMMFSPDGERLASLGYLDKIVQVWTAPAGRGLHTFEMRDVAPLGLMFTADGQLLACGGREGTVFLWNVAQGQLLHTFAHPTSMRIGAIAIQPAGHLLACGSTDFRTYLWDARSGLHRQTLEGHTQKVWALRFSPDGALLATGSDDHTIRLWESDTGRPLHLLQGHDGWIEQLSFSPDQSLLASCSVDRTIRLWEVASGRLLRTLTGHRGAIKAIDFGPDSRRLVSGSIDETIRVWDVQTGDCQAIWRVPGPYAGMNIAGVTGLTATQRTALQSLGAVIQ